MPRKGGSWTAITISQQFVQKVQKKIDKDFAKTPKSKPGIGAYIEEHLWPILEEDEILRKYGPLLEEFEVDQEKILIKDNRPDVNRIAELTFSGDVLYCDLDHSSNCVHIGFAWTVPMVYRMLLARGQKRPQIARRSDTLEEE